MAVSYEQGGCVVKVPGAVSSLSALTVEEALAPREKPERPAWKTTRYPVSMEEYDRLVEKARQFNKTESQKPPGESGLAREDEPKTGKSREMPEATHNLGAAGPGVGAPGIMTTFEGITATGWYPPDCTCAVGKTQVLLSVNSDLAGFDKVGHQLFRWPSLKSLFSAVVPGNATVFDPRLLYDHFSDRFIVIAAATRGSPQGSWLLVGISQSDDAKGPYTVWCMDASLDNDKPSNNWGDYPIAGYDEQALYITMNMFQYGGNYAYSKLRILNKTELLAGGTGTKHEITYWDIWKINDSSGANAFSINPCIHYRTAGTNLSAYMMSAIWASASQLMFWQLDSPLAGWIGSTPTLNANGISCLYYSIPPSAEQKGSTVLMATNDIRLLSAVYQNADNTQRIWTTHCSQVSWTGDAVARSGVQWYEIDVPTLTVNQQNRFGESGMYYFFPAMTVDQRRSAYLVFARSSTNEYASLYETGRTVSDPPDSLQYSQRLRAGDGPYTVSAARQRWGDYFTAVRDGQDQFRVWVYGQFAAPNNQWSTWAASLRI